jgi:hypothetical protein
MRLACVAVGLCVVGCHKPVDQGDVDAPGHGSDAIDAPADAAPGWTELISRSWTLPLNSEAYRCTRIQVPQEMWVTAFHSIAPTGTHHSVLTISNQSTPLGDYDCSAGSLDSQMLYAAGVMTDDNVLPSGVAIHLTAGMYINLNLHLFNASDNTINGTSGVMVKTVAASEVVNEADMMFSGTFNISIPADDQPHPASGGCTANSDLHIFTLWPHMHQIATHQTLVVTHNSSPTTMLDVPYNFNDQKNYPMADTIVHAGDSIQTTCTYVNNTAVTDPPAHTVTFGESSTSEMCFTGIYKYPAGGTLFSCVN